MHYVGLSRVTTLEGLHITDLALAVSPDVQKEMNRLRMEGKLDLCISPICYADQTAIEICFLNARPFHKHINDVHADSNYMYLLSKDISIF